MLGSIVLLSLLGISTLALSVRLARSESQTIVVPDDFPTIQEAINSAVDGDTIFVMIGIYYENVVVNKTVSLVGEDSSTTIIDGNETGHVIDVVSDNVNLTNFTVRRGGNTMFPDLDAGISLNNAKGCKISSNNITDNGCFGIHLLNSDQNTISGNNLTRNAMYAIDLTTSHNNTISSNAAIFNANIGIGMHVSSQENIIVGNMIISNIYGIDAAHVSENTISDNYLANNSEIGIWIQDYAINNSICGNNVTGSRYCIKMEEQANSNTVSGNILTGGRFGIQVMNAQYTEIYNNKIAHNYGSDWDAGVRLESASYTLVCDNEIFDNWRGILLYSSSPYVSVHGNNVTGNEYGIRVAMGGSNYVNVSENYVADNRGYGIDVTGFGGEGESNYATIARNLIVNNTFEAVGLGIGSNYNTVVQNSMIRNGHAAVTLERYSNYNTIIRNNMIENAYGICFDLYTVNSTQNMILNNNIINNTQQVRIAPGSVNAWNGSYPSGGNYWSEYNGTDTFCGPGQDLPGSDGKGDTPYSIDENNRDNYPLMAPYSGLDAGPPQFTNWTQNPPEQEIQPDVPVIVTIDVMDESGVKSATLLYKHNSTGSWSDWIETTMNHTKGNTYEATISPFQGETTVEYRINGTDFFDNWGATPDEGYSYIYHVIPEFNPLILLVTLLILAFAATTLKNKRALRRVYWLT